MSTSLKDMFNEDGILASKGKKITVIDNKVYDVTDFISEHPGGAVILTQLGMDATDAFNAFHPPSTQEILVDYLDEELTRQLQVVKDDNQFLQDIRNLKTDFEKEEIFESDLSFYFMMGVFNLSIFATSFGLVYYYGNSYLALTVSACLLGLFWQQCGWHAHEYLHHQVFKTRSYNNWVGGYFFGALCQGFSPSWWKDKHNTHHAVPNIYSSDPDIDTHPFLAWSENAMELYAELNDQDLASHLKMFMLHNQPVLFFPLLAFARLSWCFFSFYFATSNGQMGDSKRLWVPIHFAEPLFLSLHWIIYLTIAFTLPSTLLKSLFYLLISQTSSGVLLASVFSLNHNGMRVLSKEEAENMDFYAIQAETGRDVHPSYFMTWFCGGLNYQIEHHLFPTIPRHNFHKIQKRVAEVCKRHNINYHVTGFVEGTAEVLGRLDRVSKGITKKIDTQHLN